MFNPRKIVLDLETVPSARLQEYIEVFETEKTGRQTKKSDKPGLSYITGEIAVIGLKELNGDSVVFYSPCEKEVISDAYGYLSSSRIDTLITYNGADFDLPFLRGRGKIYGYNFEQILPYGHNNRNHVDLYKDLGGKWGMPAKLSELAWLYGIPDIFESGNHVAELWAAGRYEEVADHCRGDIEVTARLYEIIHPRGV